MKRFRDKKFMDLLDTGVFGRRFKHIPVTGSTNDHAAELAGQAGKPGNEDIDGTLILSDVQTGGRGRFNREWVSPPGGLWFSLIFRTSLPPDKVPAVTLRAAFSAAQALIIDYDIDVTIKWPNDLYHDDRKFGGILSEEKRAGDLRYIIMGMGLNIDVDRRYLDKLENKTVNIRDLTNKKIIPENLLANIMGRFEDMYFHYANTGDLDSIFRNITKILRY
jgi:BirA family biotin operon repressor/biotin-[acetyl-CoA-carboxylase] ligase